MLLLYNKFYTCAFKNWYYSTKSVGLTFETSVLILKIANRFQKSGLFIEIEYHCLDFFVAARHVLRIHVPRLCWNVYIPILIVSYKNNFPLEILSQQKISNKLKLKNKRISLSIKMILFCIRFSCSCLLLLISFK